LEASKAKEAAAIPAKAPTFAAGVDPYGVKTKVVAAKTPAFAAGPDLYAKIGATESPVARVAAETDLSKATDLQLRDIVNNPEILSGINERRAAVGLHTYDIVNGKAVPANLDSLQADMDATAELLDTPEQQKRDLFSPPKPTTAQKATVVTAKVLEKTPYVAVGNVLVKLVTGKTISQSIEDDQNYLNSLSPSALKAEMARRKADQARRTARQEGGGGSNDKSSPTAATSGRGSTPAVVATVKPKFDPYGYIA
jgi:hypothetical protein